MLSKNESKYIQSLCHKKHRDERKCFIGEGPKLADELLNSSFEVLHVYATKNYLEKRRGITAPFTEISDIELEKISALQTPNQVLVVVKQREEQHEPKLAGKLSLILDGIQDPGNFGTILRTADWFGIDQILCTPDCVELYNPKVVQATMGSITRVHVWYGDVGSMLSGAKLPVFGALLNGSDVFATGAVNEGLLVIGNESKGIREGVRQLVTHPVTIAKLGSAESLNAAVAAGIIMSVMTSTR